MQLEEHGKPLTSYEVYRTKNPMPATPHPLFGTAYYPLLDGGCMSHRKTSKLDRCICSTSEADNFQKISNDAELEPINRKRA